jgi:hypothetical protein
VGADPVIRNKLPRNPDRAPTGLDKILAEQAPGG